MDIRSKAFNLAKEYHRGKVRKAEPEKDFVLHPISVASKLMRYGYDDKVIAAALLHDIVENTGCTKEKIYDIFGSDVCSLVDGVTERDPNLSWEDRKLDTILRLKESDLRTKVIKGADAEDNTEDLKIKFGKTGEKDFSAFKRGADKKLWYWDNLYDSLVYNQDKNLPMFVNFRKNIDEIFFDSTDDSIFLDNLSSLNVEQAKKMRQLYYQNLEIYKLHDVSSTIDVFDKVKRDNKPYVIGITSTSKVDSKNLMSNLDEYFKSVGFRVKLVKQENPQNMIRTFNKIDKSLNEYYDIILVDGILDDNFTYIYKMYLEKKIGKGEYFNYYDQYMKLINNRVDKLISISCCDKVSFVKDYINFDTSDNLDRIFLYNRAVKDWENILKSYGVDIFSIDTTNSDFRDVSIYVCDNIVNSMRESYLIDIKKKLKR